MRVTVFSTTHCTSCVALKQWLADRDVTITSKVIDADPQAMTDFLAVSDGHLGVPFSLVETPDGEPVKIAGFDPRRFVAAGIDR
ncbi:MAG: glutaredoxin domain-containing protein [Dermatophilaceae bacterium]